MRLWRSWVEMGLGRDFAIRTSLYFGAIFANLGLYLPFMPIWLAWRGMTPFEIGVITSAPLFARILATPSIGLWSDARGDHRTTIIIGGWLGSACAVLLALATDFWSILVLVVGFQIATQSILPLVETKSLAGARYLGLDYGRLRLWGSAAFIGANIAGGIVVAAFGGGSVVIMVIAAVFATAIAAHGLPCDLPPARPDGVPEDANDPSAAGGLRHIWTLVRQPWFALTVIAAGLIQGSHAVFYAFSAIHWRSIGISDEWIGLLWALGVIAEIALFAISSRALSHFNAVGLLALGGAAGVLRWTVMAMEPAFWMLFPLQCLHGLTFGATYLGTLNLIQSRVPPHRAGTAQSVHSALGAGVIMGGTTLLAGLIYQQWGAVSFIVMAVFAAAGTIAALLVAVIAGGDQGKQTDIF